MFARESPQPGHGNPNRSRHRLGSAPPSVNGVAARPYAISPGACPHERRAARPARPRGSTDGSEGPRRPRTRWWGREAGAHRRNPVPARDSRGGRPGSGPPVEPVSGVLVMAEIRFWSG